MLLVEMCFICLLATDTVKKESEMEIECTMLTRRENPALSPACPQFLDTASECKVPPGDFNPNCPRPDSSDHNSGFRGCSGTLQSEIVGEQGTAITTHPANSEAAKAPGSALVSALSNPAPGTGRLLRMVLSP